MDPKTLRETKTLVQAALETNLKEQNWEKAEGNIDLALRLGVSRTLCRKASIELARHHATSGNYLHAFTAYEYAHLSAPRRHQTIVEELTILDDLFSRYLDELTKDDLILLDALISLLLRRIPKKQPTPPYRKRLKQSVEIDFPKRVTNRIPLAPRKQESKASFLLTEIFDKLDPNLTPEQRWERVAKILAPHVLRTIERQRRNVGKNGPRIRSGNMGKRTNKRRE